MIGTFTALWISYTDLTAIGLIAGPDSPPILFESIGRVVSISIFMALTVFMAVKASAPASTAATAKSAIFDTLGVNFTKTGFLTAFLTSLTTLVTVVES